MMKDKLWSISMLVLVLATTFLFPSCEGEGNSPELPSYNEKGVIKSFWFQSTDKEQRFSLPAHLATSSAQCSASWVTVEVKEGELIVKVDDYVDGKADDRTATITFRGSSDKAKIIQSKYKVMDKYVVNGYTGTVVCMQDSIRLVSSAILGETIWAMVSEPFGAYSESDGLENTLALKENPGYLQLLPALALVDALNVYCFGSTEVTQWYLPAIDELLLAYSETELCNWSWSSTEANNNDAMYNDYYSFWRSSKTQHKHYVYGFYRF